MPTIGIRSKRTKQNINMAIITDQVNALLVTLSQNTLAITGKTIAPHKAPTNTSITKISKEKLAKTIPMAVAATIVIRPINNMRVGSGLSLAIFLPYTSAIIMAESAHKSESAVEDSELITSKKNSATIIGDK